MVSFNVTITVGHVRVGFFDVPQRIGVQVSLLCFLSSSTIVWVVLQLVHLIIDYNYWLQPQFLRSCHPKKIVWVVEAIIS